MTIKLKFDKETTTRQGIICNQTINPALTLLLDQHTLMFMLGDPREMVDNLSKAKYNWKDASEEDFIKALKQVLHKDNATFESTIQQILNKDQTHVTPDELNKAVEFINLCMEHAAEMAVPT